ncbi:HAMP domain-containing sensor histidine kinase [Cohnella sp. AR92]|uniref:sensor histidine kinase n=1 Tax=Cohnella sp. AR92 TaxID=648716 RepID=UPI000F8D6EAC|nr:HAMP domain-containing sensor histidine kinase [Cohnella sp. AR92]RUS45954.1 HAMP domain-containing histidine kinase [Cohnella sp. AR92]
MKFWQKISLFSLLTFAVIFNASSIMVIERNHRNMLRQEIDNALSINMNIRSSVDAVVPLLRIYNSIDYEKTVLTNIASEFVSKNSGRGSYLEIVADDHRSIYSNLDFEYAGSRDELEQLKPDEIKYILRDIGDRTLLFTSNVADINQKGYIFTYVKDLTPLYAERVDQYRFFIQVDLAACLLYVLVMFAVSKGLTRPIDKMVRTAQGISQGNFSERVSVRSGDEIGLLAANFNRMTDVVESKILELERNNAEKQRFIDNITHELKTPLTSIIGYAHYLKATKYDERLFLEGLNVIHSEGKRLESLSAKLMDLILVKDHLFERKAENVKSVVEELAPSLELRAAAKRISLDFQCRDAFCLMDKDLIKIVLYNLVDNAVKASAEDGRIAIRTFAEGPSVLLEVADEGSGIPAEHIEHIFEPFYVADKARTRSHHGAGLGLAICRSIADIHQASIEAASGNRQGTTIRMTLQALSRENEVKDKP